MGFCRRCGDIVIGPRCKCGGTAVAPVVKWPDGPDEPVQDKWSKTYVTNSQTTSTRATSSAVTAPTSTARRFPRPTVNTTISTRVSAHIASATSSRPPSPLKQSSTLSQPTDAKAKEGILPSPHGSELAKVYGSVLQPKESLASYACASCSQPFSPDTTIYPDPSASSAEDSTRFLCRSCFVANGGSRGDCPTCNRPVLILKSEGGFVESVGRVWHKKCFVCEGCGKNIGDNPMVDLLSRPCCHDCFDSCLKRPVDSPRAPAREQRRSDHLGGSRRDSGSRESSPTLDELEKRLGISKTPAKSSTYETSSPYDSRPRALPGLASTPERVKSFSPSSSSLSAARYMSPEHDSSTERGSPGFVRYSQTRLKSPELEEESPSARRRYRHRSPAPDSLTGSPGGVRGSPRATAIQPTEEAIEEMKRRFLTGSPAATPTKPSISSNSSTPRRRSKSRSRSRPRASDTSILSSSPDETTKRHRTLRPTSSTSSLRSTLRSQRTGEDESQFDSMYPQITGESTRPLRIVRRDRTGDSQTVVQEDTTGGTSYTSASSGLVRPQRTGEPVYGVGAIEHQSTGLTLQAHRTGDTDYTMLASQVTGDTSYTKSVASHRTGNGIGSQHTGYTTFPPLRPQKSGEKDGVKSSRRESNEAANKLRVDRTGDAEVASLLGSVPASDLIDFSARTSPPGGVKGSRFTGSMSKIPVPVGVKESPARSSTTTSAYSSEGYESSVSSTPDLASDFSDTTSAISSGPSTPPSLSPPQTNKGRLWGSGKGSQTSLHNESTPTARSRTLPSAITIPEHVPSDARCQKCKELLFSIKYGGKFVTVPEEPTSTGTPPKRYHTACFRCKVCGEVFEEKEGGHAVFVRVEEGACHVRVGLF
ncbi:hypothetical protein NM688_g7201 [Phlebia brevispora]|uniref:Uncharacterized protein n=1 Tax=Phlebia brevispora TaxID=194682 RepID=A0ACC1S881_9APHY|nr:hypothetical protein NM688_g7201 [Phlebia brevispora]